MIARLYLLLPFHLAVPEGVQFALHSYGDGEYDVTVYPPVKTDRPAAGDIPDEVQINEAPAFIANGLRIDFHKDTFDRTAGVVSDPPMALVQRTVDSFVMRLRYVTRAAHIRPLRWPWVSWRLRYLNDDQSELPEEEGLVRGRGTMGFHLSLIAVGTEVWDFVHSLPPDYAPPAWDALRLDAIDAIPDTGTALVLAATCLEVLIAHTLDALAARSELPEQLWQWLNHRGDWLREPSTEEQFDALLKLFTEHSLKEDLALWEAFKNLKSARNSFVHEGVARVGGKALSGEDALKLLGKANEIIASLRQWLPDDLKWREFELKTEVKMGKKIL